MICRKCEKHVLQATELKKLCEISEKHFRKHDGKNEYYFIHENLRELKAATKTTKNALPEKVLPVSPQVATTPPKKLAGSVRTTEIVTRHSAVEGLTLKMRRNSVKAQSSPLETRRTRSVTCDNSPKTVHSIEVSSAKPQKAASINEPVDVLQIRHEEVAGENCDTAADTEVSDNNNNASDLAFIDSLTIDQIKEMTDILAEIVMPANEKPKKKKKKKDKTRFIQKLASNKFRIRVSKTVE